VRDVFMESPKSCPVDPPARGNDMKRNNGSVDLPSP
jgi:hypothetical protein